MTIIERIEQLARETCHVANTTDIHTRLHWKEGSDLVQQADPEELVALMKRLFEDPTTHGVRESVDAVINFWCATADEGLMFLVAEEVYGYDGDCLTFEEAIAHE